MSETKKVNRDKAVEFLEEHLERELTDLERDLLDRMTDDQVRSFIEEYAEYFQFYDENDDNPLDLDF